MGDIPPNAARAGGYDAGVRIALHGALIGAAAYIHVHAAGNDGKDDCEPGLSCQLVNNLELCCPYDRPASDPQCIASVAVKDAGTSDATASDAAEEPAVDEDAEADADLGSD